MQHGVVGILVQGKKVIVKVANGYFKEIESDTAG
jgi:hypothetical protein